VTSKRIEDAAPPIDPDLHQPATPPDARPDRRAGARRDAPAGAPPDARPDRRAGARRDAPAGAPPDARPDRRAGARRDAPAGAARPDGRPAAPPAGPRPDRGPDVNLDRGPARDPDAGPARGAERRSGGGSGGRWRGLGRRLRPAALAAIAVGGALGGAARYGMERALPTAPDAFPWATFAGNVSGSLALAVLLVFVLEIWPPTRYVRPFAAIGFLGAYTTFSTWMVETDELVAHHRPGLAAGYLAASLGAGLAAVSLGLVVGRAVLARRSRAGAPAGRS